MFLKIQAYLSFEESNFYGDNYFLSFYFFYFSKVVGPYESGLRVAADIENIGKSRRKRKGIFLFLNVCTQTANK